MKENKWYKKDGASTDSIKGTEKLLNTTFPEQYKSFLLWSNGGEGIINNTYIYLWAIEDLIPYNEDYKTQNYLSENYLAFGMDGDTGYIFHLPDYSIYKVEFGDMDIKSLILLAPSLTEFLNKSVCMEFIDNGNKPRK